MQTIRNDHIIGIVIRNVRTLHKIFEIICLTPLIHGLGSVTSGQSAGCRVQGAKAAFEMWNSNRNH